MNKYATLLRILETKNNYYRYIKYVKEHAITPEVSSILKGMDEYFTKNPSITEINWDSFISWYKLVKCASLSKEKHSLLEKTFSALEEEIDEKDKEPLLEYFVEKDYAIQMSDYLIRIADGDDSKAVIDIEPMLKKYKEESSRVTKVHSWVVDDDIDTILSNPSRPGLDWRLEELNISLGPLRKEDFVIFTARPDTGKTTMLASEASFMAGQLPNDQQVLWFNNEESGKKVKHRILQSAIAWTDKEISDDPIGAKAAMEKALGSLDKIVVLNEKLMNVHDIEALIENYNPGLIIFDQLWKVRGFEKSSFSEADKMTNLYGWGRSIAQRYAPVINVHQADGSAHGVQYIEQNQLYMSKCLAPGTLVRMADGCVKEVEDIQIGDKVMGMDSSSRNVTAVASGAENMYKITHKNGLSYTVNESHILTLRKTTAGIHFGHKQGDIVDIPLKDFLKYSSMSRHFKGFTQAIEYPETKLKIDPYVFGLWLSDGKSTAPEWATTDIEFRKAIENYALGNGFEYKEHTDGSCWYPRLKYKQGIKHPFTETLKDLGVYKNKHIPHSYLISSKQQRLSLLAGLIDGDGNIVQKAHDYYEVCIGNDNEPMAEQIRELALSLGFNSTIRNKTTCFVVHISGDICNIPVRIERKKTNYQSKKEVVNSTLRIESLGEGQYFGFSVDGDNRYMLANYIPTHNTGIQGEADAIVGIGRVFDPGLELTRYLYVSKNKLDGGPKSVAKERNGRWEVTIDPERVRYVSLVGSK